MITYKTRFHFVEGLTFNFTIFVLFVSIMSFAACDSEFNQGKISYYISWSIAFTGRVWIELIVRSVILWKTSSLRPLSRNCMYEYLMNSGLFWYCQLMRWQHNEIFRCAVGWHLRGLPFPVIMKAAIYKNTLWWPPVQKRVLFQPTLTSMIPVYLNFTLCKKSYFCMWIIAV